MRTNPVQKYKNTGTLARPGHKMHKSLRLRKEAVIIAEVHTARKAETPVRQQEEEEERDQDDFSAFEDAFWEEAADCALN